MAAPGENSSALDKEKILEETDAAEVSKESVQDVPKDKTPALYTPPEWAGIPREVEYSLEVLKNGAMVSKHDISGKDHAILGRSPMADVLIEHPSASRCHAVIQFNGHSGEAFLFDAGSTHGTFLNKRKLKPNAYAPLSVGDMFKIGASTRLYVFSGPTDLMPQEGFNRQQRLMMAKLKEAEHQKERDKQRAAAQMLSAISGGASWGFGEDAMEDEMENFSWKVHAARNKLTDNQQKLVDKIRARELKINHMRKECERVEANGKAADGLTDGQRAVLARNEQAIENMTEEIEDFEEDLKDSIRESISAKAEQADKKSSKKRRRPTSDDEYDGMDSDEDEYFDRTLATAKKTKMAAKKAKESVLTPEMLHEKRIDLEERKDRLAKALVDEHSKGQPSAGGGNDDDALDSFMSGIETQLEADKISSLESELKEVETEMEEVGRLLKISDPEGFFNPENVKKRKEAEARRKLQEEENKKKRTSERAAQQLQEEQGISVDKDREFMPPPPRPPPTTGSMPPPPRPRGLDAQQAESATSSAATKSNLPASVLMPPPPSRQQGLPATDARPSPVGSNSQGYPKSSQDAGDALLDELKGNEQKTSGSGRLSESDVKAQLEVSENLRALSQATKRVADSVEVAEDVTWKPPEGQTGDGRTHLNAKFGY
ncbi:hypothetical protein BSKO_06552 [Bryopsis sp. KO-2023]|nr:hypothetical protein BSKO_06552 [Bryopsis sp. KO-2023]